MKKNYFTLLLFILLIQPELRSQVTIGSGLPPNSGAILDIKEFNPENPAVDNTTAKKGGLLLPRVKLTSISDLFPMFSNDNAYVNNDGNKKDTEDLIHKGLMVYNINTDICEDLYPGVNVWNGKRWGNLGQINFPSETDIIIDDRNPSKPETYKVGKFGNAGWWMLENLRADRWPDGTTTNLYKEPVKGYPHPLYTSAMFWYPKLDKDFMNTRPEMGYLYTAYAALRTTWEEIVAEVKTENRQGICPDGWHVPTMAEFEDLRLAIYDNPCLYAHSKIKENTGYNSMQMGEDVNARSRKSEYGGFNAIPTGMININAVVNPNPDYPVAYPAYNEFYQKVTFPDYALFWLSDSTTDSVNPATTVAVKLKSAAILKGEPSIRYAITTSTNYESVRCKKNETKSNLATSKTQNKTESFKKIDFINLDELSN